MPQLETKTLGIHPTQPKGAVLLLQEIYGLHNRNSATRLYRGRWREHIDPAPEVKFDPNTILDDSQRSQLLVDAIDKLLYTLDHPVYSDLASTLSTRFGLEDDKITPTAELAKISKKSQPVVRRELKTAVRLLRHPARSRFLKTFLSSDTISVEAYRLTVLPAIIPHVNGIDQGI